MGLAVGCGDLVHGWVALVGGLHAEEPVNLALGQRPVAGRCGHHEVAHQLDLGLKVTIGQAVLGFRHEYNRTRHWGIGGPLPQIPEALAPRCARATHRA